MRSSKEVFLSVIGVEDDYPSSILLDNDLVLQRKDEREPFGELFTRDGHTTLRVGAVYEDGIKILI